MTSETPEQLQAAYRAERAATIARLNKLLGNATVPLDEVAGLLPENPEWTAGVPRRRRGSDA